MCKHPGCGKVFTYENGLRRHAKLHTEGEQRNFACGECPKKFTTQQNLDTHIRIHTGERPFACQEPDCSASFKMAHHLARHSLMHTGERAFACDYPNCGAKFADKGDRKKHFDCMHTVEGQQKQKKQEERVAKALTAAGIHFKREHHVDMSCFGGTFAREDFLCDHVPGGIVTIEVDEDQHKGYTSCDLKRVDGIRNAMMIGGNTLPWLLIRYNPDAFRVDEELQSVPKKDREAALVKLIKEWKFCQDQKFQMQYMFYDGMKQGGSVELSVWQDSEYVSEYKDLCLPPVFCVM